MNQNYLARFICSAAVLALALNASGAAKADKPAKKVAYLGVTVADVSDTVRSQLQLTPGVGLAIEQVLSDSPAMDAGLKKHDLLEKCDDQLLFNGEQFAALIRSHHPGDEVTLGILRQGKPQKVEVALGEHELPKPAPPPSDARYWVPGSQPFFAPNWFKSPEFKGFEFKPFQPWVLRGPGYAKKKPGGFLGAELRPVDPSLAAQLGLDENTGALVGHIVEDSPAQKAHLQEYDVILKIDGETIKGPADLSERIQKDKPGQSVRLEILRQAKAKDIEATLGERKTAEFDVFQPLLRQYRYVPKIVLKPLPERPGQSIIRFEGVEGRDTENAEQPGENKRAVIVVNSDDGTMTVRQENQKRSVTVKSPDGKILFEGPITNESQRAGLPPEIRNRLEQIGAQIRLPTGPREIQEMRVWNPPSPPI